MFWVVLCAPQNVYVEVLTHSISEGDLILRQNLYRGDQVKVRSLGQALIQYD